MTGAMTGTLVAGRSAAVAPAPTPTLPRGAGEGEGLRRAAEAFEAQALGALLQPMFEGLETRSPFGGGAAEQQWRPMLVEAIARGLARTGGVGLADAVLGEMLRLQGARGEAEERVR
jgi:Rod binding domain-containing protein